ncbi:MAG TPA: hypothetical protein VFW19_17355, partial [Allosphingosinicella sp.]|nr:hypothetical protein [Allosphingosinicella sp.]
GEEAGGEGGDCDSKGSGADMPRELREKVGTIEQVPAAPQRAAVPGAWRACSIFAKSNATTMIYRAACDSS